MNIILKILLGTMLLSCSLAKAANLTTSGAWKVAVDNEFIPFSYTDEQGNLTGLHVDIIKAAMDKAGIKYELSAYPWKRVVYLTDHNEVVFSIPWRGKEERFKKYFMKGPLSSSKTVFFERKGENIHYQTLNDLKKYSIGFVDGWAYPKEFEEATYLTKRKQSVTGAPLLKMLVNKRFNILIGDITVISSEAKKHGMLNDINVISGPDIFGDVKRYAAFNKANKIEADKFTVALESLKGTSELKAIFAKYGLSE